MTRKVLFKLTASGIIALLGVAATTASVTANDGAPREDAAGASRSADRAQELLEKGKTARAIAAAERAVELSPSNAGHRALLGQVYLSVGRFASAQESFDAAVQLGDTSTHTVVGHALALIGTGHQDQALGLVEANAQTLPASDYGLALALAGQAERGAMVLADVVRAGEATARDRQNLALSLALAGRWLEARLIAAQDLGPNVAGERMEQWAAIAQTPDHRMRVASVLGTSVTEDPGMPVRLALNGDAPRRTLALASPAADPAPLAQYAPPPPAADAVVIEQPAEAEVAVEATEPAQPVPVMLAEAPVAATEAQVMAMAEVTTTVATAVALPQADEPMTDEPEAVAVAAAEPQAAEAPQPVAVAMAEPRTLGDVADEVAPVAVAANESAAPVPAMVFVSNPVIQPLRTVVASVAPLRSAEPVPATPRRAARRTNAPVAALAMAGSTRFAAPTGAVRTTGWAVQLGAYDSVGVASQAWSRLGRRHALLGSHDGVTTAATVDGKNYYRLAATGFQTRANAQAACNAVVRAGGRCFVRNIAQGEQVRWASRDLNRRVASR